MAAPRNLASIDDIRHILSPERLARRGETARGLAGTRLWVDGKPVMVYPVPTDNHVAAELVRLARRTAAILATLPGRSPQLRGLMTDEQRHARTEANLDRLRARFRATLRADARRARRGAVVPGCGL